MSKVWEGIGRFSFISLLVYLYFSVREFRFAIEDVELGLHSGLGFVFLVLLGIVVIVGAGIFIIIDWFKP